MTPTAANADDPLTDFARAVLVVVGEIEKGDVMTYGEVAAEMGQPGAARAVGSVLRRHGSEVPWWRVVAASGRLVPGSERRHAKHLAADGIEVKNGRVVMA